MSKRTHIKDGTKRENLRANYGLIYTCNAGWIDLGHLNSESDRLEIGASNLWKQISGEGKPAVDPACRPAPMGDSIERLAHRLGRPDRCSVDPEYKGRGGFKGFVVHYRQDHARYPFKPGRDGKCLVRYGLDVERKKQVALAIFMEVSTRFEESRLAPFDSQEHRNR